VGSREVSGGVEEHLKSTLDIGLLLDEVSERL